MYVHSNRARKVSDNQQQKRVHLPFLDGIRALMAVIVVMEHIYQALKYSDYPPVLPKWMWNILGMFNVGQAPVVVFICLSGFVLTLPVLKGKFDIGSFAKKRFLRIYPPYIAGLAFSLLMALSSRWLYEGSHTTAVSAGSLLTHTLLVHNFTKYITSLNGTHWTVAVEVQIYVLFALVWQPLAKRFGITIPNLLFTMAPIALTLAGCSLQYEYQLYVSYFAFGGLTALCWLKALDNGKFNARMKYVSYVGHLILSSVIGFIVTNRGAYASSLQAPIDVLIAIATCLIILNLSLAGTSRSTPIQTMKGCLESPFLSDVASYSYSLYLIHYPVVILVCKFARDIVDNDFVRVALAMCGLPIAMALSKVFALIFENQSSTFSKWLNKAIGATRRQAVALPSVASD